jgi:hypothetical protein
VIKVKVGDRVAIMREGKFKVSSGVFVTRFGQRGLVLKLESRSNRKKKVWAYVDVYGDGGNSIGRIYVPGWWLEPRSILDDLAEV